MPTRGPKPKSREQRIREGNPSRRPLPEPVVVGGRPADLEPPEYLEEDGKLWWSEAIPVLAAVGILDTVDRAALEMAATAYARFRACRRIIEAEGHLTKGSVGQKVAHPALAEERAAQNTYLRFAEQYALTPVARTRLGLAELQRRSMAQEMDAALGKPEFEAVN